MFKALTKKQFYLIYIAFHWVLGTGGAQKAKADTDWIRISRERDSIKIEIRETKAIDVSPLFNYNWLSSGYPYYFG